MSAVPAAADLRVTRSSPDGWTSGADWRLLSQRLVSPLPSRLLARRPRVTCILVERGYRGQGLAAVALRGAVELIAQAGGGVVEGYPHDTSGVRKKNSSFLYNGTRTMYEREGFTYDRPKGLGNCVMVRDVTANHLV